MTKTGFEVTACSRAFMKFTFLTLSTSEVTGKFSSQKIRTGNCKLPAFEAVARITEDLLCSTSKPSNRFQTKVNFGGSCGFISPYSLIVERWKHLFYSALVPLPRGVLKHLLLNFKYDVVCHMPSSTGFLRHFSCDAIDPADKAINNIGTGGRRFDVVP